MNEFRLEQDRRKLLRKIGHMSQVAGLKKYELADGRARGVEAVDVTTGGGFRYTVLPGRGMDIAWTEYRGVPLSYIAPNGVVSARYYESEGMGWIRNFFAGLLTTCGMSNVGWPSSDEVPELGNVDFGLHGRLSNSEASGVNIEEGWVDGVYRMRTTGQIRETNLHAENLCLKREIESVLGANRLVIRDQVTNDGFHTRPLMLLYHINIGYPVLDKGSRFISGASSIEASDDESRRQLSNWMNFSEPEPDAAQLGYYHDMDEDGDGCCNTAVINPALGLGVYVRYKKNNLPFFNQWMARSEETYAVGIEPGNCLPIGRTESKKRGSIDYLEPGETKDFEIEIGVLDGNGEIEAYEKKTGPKNGGPLLK